MNVLIHFLCSFFFFFFFEVLRPSEPNGVMSSAVRLPNHTFTGQAWSSVVKVYGRIINTEDSIWSHIINN